MPDSKLDAALDIGLAYLTMMAKECSSAVSLNIKQAPSEGGYQYTVQYTEDNREQYLWVRLFHSSFYISGPPFATAEYTILVNHKTVPKPRPLERPYWWKLHNEDEITVLTSWGVSKFKFKCHSGESRKVRDGGRISELEKLVTKTMRRRHSPNQYYQLQRSHKPGQISRRYSTLIQSS